MNEPRKLYRGSGENFKQRVVETLNAIIDILHARRIIAGHDVKLNESASGTTISIVKHPVAPSNISGSPVPSIFIGPLQIIRSDTAAVKIVNTATYSEESGSSAGSIVRINNVEYLLADFPHSPGSGTTYYYVRFVPPLSYLVNGTTTTQTASASIVASSTVKTSADPSDNYANYYRIGYVVRSGDSLTIVNEIIAQPVWGWFVNIYPD